MTERNPFEHKPAGPGRESLRDSGALSCEEWEMLLTEALDGLLPGAERTAFDAHSAECRVCAELLKQSKQGQEWLEFLEAEPEVPSDLVERIVGKTSGTVAGGPLALPGAAPIAAAPHVLGIPVRRVMWDTRMVMTAAMAFFSIALTLNLAGVKLTNLRLSDLTPASMEMNLTRQFYGAEKSLVQYYDNLRLVYEVESKMRDIRRAQEIQQAQPKKEVPANPQGNGHKNGGKLEPGPKAPQDGALRGDPSLASLTGAGHGIEKPETETEEGVEIAVFFERMRAERSLA